MNRVALLGLVVAVRLLAVDSPPNNDQERLIGDLRQYAEQYIANLPNFVCQRVTQQFDAGKKPKHWRQRETIAARLVYSQGREEQTLQTVNNRPVHPGSYVNQPLETEGEFGILLSNVLTNPGTEMTFSRWEDVSGRHLAVFEYSIDRQHSTLSLGLGGSNVVLPYRGLVYADPATAEVLRITSSPFDIPKELAAKSVTTTVDYDAVNIAGRRFVLPVSASILLDTGERNLLNQVSFTEYRKFEAESSITYLSDGSK